MPSNAAGVATCVRGDALDPTLLAAYEGAVACVTADPPYGSISKASWEVKDAVKFYIGCAAIADELLLPGGSLLVWGGIGKPYMRSFLRSITAIEENTNFVMRNLITWSKRRAYGKADDYLFTREELAWFVRKDEKPRVFNIPLLEEKRGYAGFNPKYPAKSEFKRRTNVWNDITELMRGKVHDAEKPSRLYEVIYETHSSPGELVVDLFAGSGAAGLAAKKTGRRCVLVESDGPTFDAMSRRVGG